MTRHDDARSERAYDRVRETSSWVDESIEEWKRLSDGEADPSLGERMEEARGVPPTPGWKDV